MGYEPSSVPEGVTGAGVFRYVANEFRRISTAIQTLVSRVDGLSIPSGATPGGEVTRAEFDTLSTEVQTVGAGVASQSSRIYGTELAVSSLNTSVASLESADLAIQESVGTLAASLDSLRADLGPRVSAVEAGVAFLGASQEKELRVPAGAASKGASAPTDALRAIGASGGVKIPVSQFSKTTQQDLYFEIHPDTDMDHDQSCAFHLMWLPGASWTTGNFVWKLEYITIDEESGVVTSGTPTTITFTCIVTSATQFIECRSPFSVAVPDGHTVCVHLYRDVAADDGNDVGEVRFLELVYKTKSGM